LGEYLASNGFIVFVVYHSDKDKRHPGPFRKRKIELQRVAELLLKLNTQSEVQLSDVTKTISHNIFFDKMDLSKGVGIVGHSFGGSTVLGFWYNSLNLSTAYVIK
jgi:predicted dienelactone hydrolase